jgi:hypothetical protein
MTAMLAIQCSFSICTSDSMCGVKQISTKFTHTQTPGYLSGFMYRPHQGPQVNLIRKRGSASSSNPDPNPHELSRTQNLSSFHVPGNSRPKGE